MVNVIDCDIVICKFKLKTQYNVPFLIRERYEFSYRSSYWLKRTTTVLQEGWH